MAKITIVEILGLTEEGAFVYTSNKKQLLIKSYRYGVLSVEASTQWKSISEFAEFVVGCFDSHFIIKNLKAVDFTLDQVNVTITKAEAIDYPLEYIVNKWNEAWMDKIAKETSEMFSKYFTVKNFDNCVLELEPSKSSTIYQMAAGVAGCFGPSSPFKDVYEVNFTFDGKKVYVIEKENATPVMIYKKWCDAPYEN